MSNSGDGETKIISGQVKWYDPVKGYGFIVPEHGESDVLVHSTCVRGSGRVTLLEGARVRVVSTQGARGLQAREILEIEDPEPAGSAGPGFSDSAKPTEFLREDTRIGPMQPARVKWFDKQKGFGFINIFGDPEDVFVHMEILRRCGFQDLIGGEAVVVRTFRGPRGLMAAEVGLWESATREKKAGQTAERKAGPAEPEAAETRKEPAKAGSSGYGE